MSSLNAGQAGKRERVDRELGNRLVGPRVGFIVEDVHGAVSDLDKINVAVIELSASPKNSQSSICSYKRRESERSSQPHCCEVSW
jgi:hypothetical protein